MLPYASSSPTTTATESSPFSTRDHPLLLTHRHHPKGRLPKPIAATSFPPHLCKAPLGRRPGSSPFRNNEGGLSHSPPLYRMDGHRFRLLGWRHLRPPVSSRITPRFVPPWNVTPRTIYGAPRTESTQYTVNRTEVVPRLPLSHSQWVALRIVWLRGRACDWQWGG
ncbi:hypothetical protein BC829DRAFT_105641 [Chytridium lagenaria]|nr:hypothetical protein BC829DRAFT_105641 [Chytridium lagenaria]